MDTEVEKLDKELSAKRIHLGLAEKWLQGAAKRLERQRLIEASLRETLRFRLQQPVILLAEFRSLKNGLRSSLAEIHGLTKEMKTITKARIKLLEEVERLERARERVPSPPRVVLEFRRDNQ